MYPARETQADAVADERRQMDQAEGPHGFRPLALPALAAAARVHAVKAPKRQSATTQRRGILDLVHEDTPIL